MRTLMLSSHIQRLIKTSAAKRCLSSQPRVKIQAQPADLMVDERFTINISGLKPRERISVKASVREASIVFTGLGCYEAGVNGEVDVASHESIGGTYTGRDAMALIWSMKQAPGQRPGMRLVKSDVTTPQIVDLSLFNDHVSFEEVHREDVRPLTSCQIVRRYLPHDVTRLPVREGSVRGTLFIPTESGPFPGIIDMNGTAGGLQEARASVLAGKGFTVLSLAFFGYEDLPVDSHHLDLQYFKDAVDFLCGHPKVKSGGIGFVGLSKGGELSQLTALHCPQVRAVVSMNGFPYLSGHPLKHGAETFQTLRPFDPSRWEQTSDGVSLVPLYPALGGRDYFPIWEKDVHLLSVCGADDKCIPDDVQTTQHEMYPEEHKHKMELLMYPGAGHLLLMDPPYCPHIKFSYHKVFKVILVSGGSSKEHAYAQEDGWRRIIEFLKKHLS